MKCTGEGGQVGLTGTEGNRTRERMAESQGRKAGEDGGCPPAQRHCEEKASLFFFFRGLFSYFLF